MGDQDSLQITVLIAGRPYPLKIKSSDESVIRRVVREINDSINKFQLDYPNRDKQDGLALTALNCAGDLEKVKLSASNDPDLPEKLTQLDHLLDQLLL
ncbi:MAG: cell division protein ZapA [Saprospirales bacterium]|nr:cell division protein ZapA [Saprospirales bacterium]